MATTKGRAPKTPQAPRPKQQPIRWIWLCVTAALGAAVFTVAYFAATGGGGATGQATASTGLPNAAHYHSLLVSPADPDELFLGTHEGIYRSTDGGGHWASYRLAGQDAMSLARPAESRTVWMAGHNVFARSRDGGRSWHPLAPATLPSLDIHGFAVDPRRPSTVYAAVAGIGLFRSVDGGSRFAQVSREIGGSVIALAVTPSGELLAGDLERGLVASRDGGKTWRETLNAKLAGLALNPSNAKVILATGPGILRSKDSGNHWSQVLRIGAGAGPVAWSLSNPKLAYVVGFDDTLYRSTNSGASWAPVR